MCILLKLDSKDYCINIVNPGETSDTVFPFSAIDWFVYTDLPSSTYQFGLPCCRLSCHHTALAPGLLCNEPAPFCPAGPLPSPFTAPQPFTSHCSSADVQLPSPFSVPITFFSIWGLLISDPFSPFVSGFESCFLYYSVLFYFILLSCSF